MAKYSFEFKRMVVMEYVNGRGGLEISSYLFLNLSLKTCTIMPSIIKTVAETSAYKSETEENLFL